MSGAQAALHDFARRVLSLRPLADALDAPLRLAVPGDASLGALNRIAEHLEVREFDAFTGQGHLTSFDRIAAAQLGDDAFALAAAIDASPEGATLLDRVQANSLAATCVKRTLKNKDGSAIVAYACGAPQGTPVILAPACGMPIELAEQWIAALSARYRVLTWESRGLFAPCERFDAIGYTIEAQACDLVTVMDHFEVPRAHLMGLCGGAVIALAAAAAQPARFSSLSLWYGDYDLGAASTKTHHQRELIKFLAMVRTGRKEAAALQKLFRDPAMIAKLPQGVAHLILYPYASAELLYRYAVLNGAIMETDISPLLARIAAPALVVTSEDDLTAHPAGSRAVAAGLPNATLHVEPHGDHLALFAASSQRAAVAASFIDAPHPRTGALSAS